MKECIKYDKQGVCKIFQMFEREKSNYNNNNHKKITNGKRPLQTLIFFLFTICNDEVKYLFKRQITQTIKTKKNNKKNTGK